jgi:hypothetical protein
MAPTISIQNMAPLYALQASEAWVTAMCVQIWSTQALQMQLLRTCFPVGPTFLNF